MTIYLLFGVVMVVLLFFVLLFLEGKKGFGWVPNHGITLCALLGGVYFGVTPFVYEFPRLFKGSYPVTFGEDGQIKEHRFGLWTYGKEWWTHKPHELVIYDGTAAVVTREEKVVFIKYRIRPVIGNATVFFTRYKKELARLEGAQTHSVNERSLESEMFPIVKSFCGDFNDTHLKEIEEILYLSRIEQQAAFKELVESYFARVFEGRGLEVECYGFELN